MAGPVGAMDCHQVQDDLDLLALGTLDPSEAERLRVHVAACARCRAGLDAAEELVARLALAVPPVQAPETLRAAVLGAVHRDRSVESARPGPLRKSVPRLSGPGRLAVPWGVAAAVVIALGSAIAWIARLQEQVQELQQETATMRRRTDGLLLFAVPSSIRADFQPATELRATGAVTWNPDRGVCYVVFERLPRPEPGTAYRLWYVADGVRRVDAGEVVPDEAGRADLVIDASRWRGQSYELVLRRERAPHDPEAPAILIASLRRP
jgi:anti-sigma factor (TIGR02949 family)